MPDVRCLVYASINRGDSFRLFWFKQMLREHNVLNDTLSVCLGRLLNHNTDQCCPGILFIFRNRSHCTCVLMLTIHDLLSLDWMKQAMMNASLVD